VTRSRAGTRTAVTVVSSVERYRRLARTLPLPGETVLEIGCSTGEATRLLAERIGPDGWVVAVDVSAEMADTARRALASHPHAARVTVAELDGRNAPALVRLLETARAGDAESQQQHPDAGSDQAGPHVIFLDVGGDAQMDSLAFAVRQCLRTFVPRALVVRSAELAALCGRVVEVETPDEGPAPEADPLLPAEAPGSPAHALAHLIALSRSTVLSNRVFAARKLRLETDPAARARLAELADDPEWSVRRVVQSSGPVQSSNPSRPRR
jgi:SAM-dependent methyltransferase